MKWEFLTSPELGQVDRHLPVVVPIAAVEQHGPHLPLATDSLIADHFMTELNREAPQEVLILPTIRVACSEHHMFFPGTLTVIHETFLAYLMEVAGSIIRHSFREIIIFNCHGGNLGIGQVALEKLGYRNPEVRFTLVTWWKLAAQPLAGVQESGAGGVGHACEFETSLLQFFAPELVRTDLIPPEMTNVPAFVWAEGDMLRGGAASVYRRMDQMTPNGVYGAPFLANAKKGQIISRLVVSALSQLIRDLKTQR